jgi:hypothetical protein
MKKIISLSILLLMVFNISAQINTLSKEDQINAAIQAAPKEKRDGASVLGFNVKGELIELRKGTNEFICLADDPSDKSFSVACYHKDLEPFMARGRALKKEGKTRQEKFDIREKEVKSGKLKMPKQPTTLYILFGKDAQYDTKTKSVLNGFYRWVVYTPWATAESTGLPTYPMVPGGPWIMNPGTHKAHIMISPITCPATH